MISLLIPRWCKTILSLNSEKYTGRFAWNRPVASGKTRRATSILATEVGDNLETFDKKVTNMILQPTSLNCQHHKVNKITVFRKHIRVWLTHKVQFRDPKSTFLEKCGHKNFNENFRSKILSLLQKRYISKVVGFSCRWCIYRLLLVNLECDIDHVFNFHVVFTLIYGGYKMVYSNGDISKITRVHGLGLL